MACGDDYDSGLPIRSESDGSDERLHVKIVDGTTSPAVNQVEVDSDNNLHVEMHGNNPAGTDTVLKLSELGYANTDGIYDVTNNTDPSNNGVIVHTRAVTPGDAEQGFRPTGVNGIVDTDVWAIDVSMHDEDGNAYTENNPMPVTFEESEQDEIHEFEESTAVARHAQVEHTYSVADGKILTLYGVHASASGKLKVELHIGDGAASEVFATKDITFNSTAHPDANMDFYRVPIVVTGTVDTTTVKVILCNRDWNAMDVHSTIIGILKDA